MENPSLQVSDAAVVPSGCPVPDVLHMYTFPTPLSSPTPRSKRRQVKNACTNCQKACKKCDDARPCLRCVKYGISDECTDSARKERKKGVKRGPYKKRNGKYDNPDGSRSEATPMMPTASVGISGYAGTPMPLIGTVSYPPIYPYQVAGKPGEMQLISPVYVVTPHQGLVHASQAFYPAAYMPYPPGYIPGQPYTMSIPSHMPSIPQMALQVQDSSSVEAGHSDVNVSAKTSIA